MLNEEYNARIEKIAEIITQDRTPLDEQNESKLKRYHDFVKERFNIEGEAAFQLVNEAFLYLKLKNADAIDPLQHGDQFGAGFS